MSRALSSTLLVVNSIYRDLFMDLRTEKEPSVAWHSSTIETSVDLGKNMNHIAMTNSSIISFVYEI